MDSQHQKVRVATLSVVSNATLTILKLIVGLLIGSVSIISEAIHSGVDLIAAAIALFSVKTSSIPPDHDHPFGHGKIENMSGTIEAILIFLAAGWIIYEAVKKLFHPEPIETIGWGIGVMLLSAVVNIGVSHMLFKVGRETDSIALQADAWHLRTDVYTSAGVMIGLALIWTAERFFPAVNVDWLDPAAAISVAFMIIKAACDLTRQAARDLLDVNLPPEEEAWIRQRIRDHQPLIHGFHQLRTRKSGHFRFVECHLKVDPLMTVLSSHQITEDLTVAIEEKYPDTSVTIHVEPCDGRCEAKCLAGCLLPEDTRREIRAGR
jgi:cation diffusion facilitator family transporter